MPDSLHTENTEMRNTRDHDRLNPVLCNVVRITLANPPNNYKVRKVRNGMQKTLKLSNRITSLTQPCKICISKASMTRLLLMITKETVMRNRYMDIRA